MANTNSNVTLNRLIEEFFQMASAHEMLEFFAYGNFLHIVQSDKVKYNVLMMNTNNAQIDENYITFSVELMVAG